MDFSHLLKRWQTDESNSHSQVRRHRGSSSIQRRAGARTARRKGDILNFSPNHGTAHQLTEVFGSVLRDLFEDYLDELLGLRGTTRERLGGKIRQVVDRQLNAAERNLKSDPKIAQWCHVPSEFTQNQINKGRRRFDYQLLFQNSGRAVLPYPVTRPSGHLFQQSTGALNRISHF